MISREHLRIHCILYEQDTVTEIAPFVYATDLSANGTYLKKNNAESTGSQGRGILMGKNSSFLLDDRDELRLSETVTLIYRSNGMVKQSYLTQTQEREMAILSPRYLITGRLLGEGGYGKVLIGIDQRTQRQLACKIVNLEKLYDRRADLRINRDGDLSSSQTINRLPDRVRSCFREFDILKDLSHPNIVHIQKVFWSQSTIYMFQELVTGGDLFSYIEYKHGKIPSIESAVIIRQILKGVQYLHAQEIVHRDLKPDNILMTSLDNGARVVITDFGNARHLPNTGTQSNYSSKSLKRMFSVVGTLEYTAPEIHQENGAIPDHYGYSLSVDMWSIGSITAAILTGEQIFGCRQDGPFEEDPRRIIIKLAAQCDLSVLDDEYHPLWGPIGPAPKDFIKRLLVLKEEDRMSAAEALKHSWFTRPHVAAEFDAQYERSIKGWRPRHKDDQLIEQISKSFNSGTNKGSKLKFHDNTPSRFFADQQVSEHVEHQTENHHKEGPQVLDRCELLDNQFDSHLAHSAYDCNYINDEVQSYGQDETHFRSDEHRDLALCWASDDRRAYAEPEPDSQAKSQSKRYDNLNRLAVGQLQRVSTSTRGKYFEREIVDLDDLAGQCNDETAASPNIIYAQTHARLHREDTVQVRRTPFADDEEFGVDQWWHQRYPQTQFYFYTQAEPITQEENSVVVQETPPRILATPLRTRVRDLSMNGDGSGRQPGFRKVEEMFPARHISKRRKVYGRQR